MKTHVHNRSEDASADEKMITKTRLWKAKEEKKI